MAQEWLGKPVESVGDEEVSAAARDKQRAIADYAALLPENRTRLKERLTDLLLNRQDQVDVARNARNRLAAVVDLAKAERQRGVIEGMRIALAGAPVAAAPATQPADDCIDGTLPWTEYLPSFYTDRPGLTKKTRASYQSAFNEWMRAAELEGVPLRDIAPRHLIRLADHLRDRANGHDGQRKLHRKTIVRSLGHVKVFVTWAIAKRHLADKGFAVVRAREATREERVEKPRRAFTVGELQRLFDSPLFVGHERQHRWQPGEVCARDEYFWFFVIAALTGARTEEIANAPAVLVKVGTIDCIDLREVGTKSGAGARLMPVISDLRRLGFLDWSAAQAAQGRGLIFNPRQPRTADAWSKWCNRYIDATVTDDPAVVLYSLRHSFRQTLRAARLGDELMNKVFGHEAGDVGEGYGRDLAPDEAQAVVDNVKSPISLEHLWRRPRKT